MSLHDEHDPQAGSRAAASPSPERARPARRNPHGNVAMKATAIVFEAERRVKILTDMIVAVETLPND